jgi:putative membrane protein insertion efficiency factor
MKLINKFLIIVIKFYKYFFSPYLPASCRYLPTCSEYFIESLKIHGTLKGSCLGVKRIFRCHPIKVLGAKDGYDPVPNFKKGKK